MCWGGRVVDDVQLQSIVFSATGYVHSSTPYHPRGVPIFPNRPETNKQNKTKRTEKIGDKARNNQVKHDEKCGEGESPRQNEPFPFFADIVSFSRFEGAKVRFR
jgi:type II secretory pathway component PulC